MYPFYENDIKSGKIDEKRAFELLECLWIKFNEVVFIRSEDSAKYFAGFPTGYNMILGGVDKSGKDSTNRLSYLCLEVTSSIRLPQPNVSIRIHTKSPVEFLRKASEMIRLGFGIPQVFNDEVIIPALLNRGISLEDARDYAVVGCVEVSVPGKVYGLHDIALFNLLKVMELAMFDGKCLLTGEAFSFKTGCKGNFTTFEQFMDSIKKQIDYYVKHMVIGCNLVDEAHNAVAPTPLLSVFIEDCLKKGVDVTGGGAKYNFSGVQGIGTANLADSLWVVKKLVFKEKIISLIL